MEVEVLLAQPEECRSAHRRQAAPATPHHSDERELGASADEEKAERHGLPEAQTGGHGQGSERDPVEPRRDADGAPDPEGGDARRGVTPGKRDVRSTSRAPPSVAPGHGRAFSHLASSAASAPVARPARFRRRLPARPRREDPSTRRRSLERPASASDALIVTNSRTAGHFNLVRRDLQRPRSSSPTLTDWLSSPGTTPVSSTAM